MAILLRDFRGGASPKPKVGKQMMQIRQRRQRHARLAEPQLRAGDRIEHPGRNDGDHAESDFDVEYLAVRAPLNGLPPQIPPEERVPAIVDDDVGPDMGRMSP
jgi:hypothetical protein